MQVLYDFMCMSALPVGMHHNHATLLDGPLQMVFDVKRRNRGVGIAGYDIPENELEAEGTDHVDRDIIEFSIGRAKQRGFMAVSCFEQTNWSENFLSLLVRWMKRQMGMDIAMGADFKKWNLEQGPYLLIVFRDPFPGHEEGGRNLVFNQIIDECLIVARSVSHRAEIERQGNSRA